MCVLRFLDKLAKFVFTAIMLICLSTLLVIFKISQEEIIKVQCAINYDQDQLDQLFQQKEITTYQLNRSCSHINATIKLKDDTPINGLLVRLAVIKQTNLDELDIQVFIQEHNIIALINNGEVIISGK